MKPNPQKIFNIGFSCSLCIIMVSINKASTDQNDRTISTGTIPHFYSSIIGFLGIRVKWAFLLNWETSENIWANFLIIFALISHVWQPNLIVALSPAWWKYLLQSITLENLYFCAHNSLGPITIMIRQRHVSQCLYI